MNKRKNEGEINEKTKQKKPNDDIDSKEIPVAVDVHNEASSPPILKLNALCCDDLFEWLSLKDLHSLGQTCKRMHRLTGLYFQQNYKGTPFCKGQEIYQNYYSNRISGFREFVPSIHIQTNSPKDYEYIGEYCNSLRKITIGRTGLFSTNTIELIDDRLDKVDTVILLRLYKSTPYQFYEDFLKFCPNLKTLRIESPSLADNDWMCHEYPNLKDFMIINRSQNVSSTIGTFFQNNTQLRHFRTNYSFLLTNRDTFIKSEIKLDLFTIFYDRFIKHDFDDVFILLNKLYDNGFYKRLDFRYEYYKPISKAVFNQIATLRGLEKLGGHFGKNTDLSLIPNLTELIICDEFNVENIDFEAITGAFPNLHQVDLQYVNSIVELLPFIRRLPKLKKINIIRFHTSLYGTDYEDDEDKKKKIYIDLSKLHVERKKLPGACKLIIHVPEWLFWSTKMAAKNLYINHDLIEIQIHFNGDMPQYISRHNFDIK